MAQLKNIEMNGVTYGLTPMNPMAAAGFGLRLVKCLSAAIGELLEGEDLQDFVQRHVEGEEAEMESTQALNLAALFMKSIPFVDAEELSVLLSMVLDKVSASVPGQSAPIRFDDPDNVASHFDGDKYGADYYPVTCWAAYATAKPFLLGAIPGMKQVFLGAAPAQSQSPSQKTGGSNGSSAVQLPPATAPTQN